MSILTKVLEKSVELHGNDHPLTLGHLLNIARLIDRIEEHQADEQFEVEQEAYNSIHDSYGN